MPYLLSWRPCDQPSPFGSCKWECLCLHVSRPRMSRKGEVGQRLPWLLPGTTQKWDHGKSTDTWVKIRLLGLVLLSPCLPEAVCCCQSENAGFSEAVVSSEVNFKEWASALLPKSGWTFCCCNEKRWIYPLVDLNAEKSYSKYRYFLIIISY